MFFVYEISLFAEYMTEEGDIKSEINILLQSTVDNSKNLEQLIFGLLRDPNFRTHPTRLCFRRFASFVYPTN